MLRTSRWSVSYGPPFSIVSNACRVAYMSHCERAVFSYGRLPNQAIPACCYWLILEGWWNHRRYELFVLYMRHTFRYHRPCSHLFLWLFKIPDTISLVSRHLFFSKWPTKFRKLAYRALECKLWNQGIPGELGQHPCCWCPDLTRCGIIKTQTHDCTNQTIPFLPATRENFK